MQTKIKVVITIILMLSTSIVIPTKADIENNVTAVYFYSSTCSSCYKLNEYFKDIEQKYSNLRLLKYDPLLGLKENVIIGKLIPAGTGMNIYRDIKI